MSQLLDALWRLLTGAPGPAQVADVERAEREAKHATAKAKKLDRMLRLTRSELASERAHRVALARKLEATQSRLRAVREYAVRQDNALAQVSARESAVAATSSHVRFVMPHVVINE